MYYISTMQSSLDKTGVCVFQVVTLKKLSYMYVLLSKHCPPLFQELEPQRFCCILEAYILSTQCDIFSPIGDAESIVVHAAEYQLAVGKPGDTFSVSADSALGRSSVITDTTAGVTQFSEVSQITDCYWCSLF